MGDSTPSLGRNHSSSGWWDENSQITQSLPDIISWWQSKSLIHDDNLWKFTLVDKCQSQEISDGNISGKKINPPSSGNPLLTWRWQHMVVLGVEWKSSFDCAVCEEAYNVYLQRGEKVEPQWQKTRHGGKTGFVCSSRRSTFCSQCTVHSHSHSGAQTDTVVARRSSPPWVVWKTVTNVKEASFVWTQSSSKLSHTSCV